MVILEYAYTPNCCHSWNSRCQQLSNILVSGLLYNSKNYWSLQRAFVWVDYIYICWSLVEIKTVKNVEHLLIQLKV